MSPEVRFAVLVWGAFVVGFGVPLLALGVVGWAEREVRRMRRR